MKKHLFIGFMAIALTATLALAATQTFKYVCHNEKCKSYKTVFTFEENIRYEHKCPTCGQRLDDAN